MATNTEHYQSALAALGLQQDPFGPARGPGWYYASPALRQRIDLVRHLLEHGRQIVVITGPPQAGKSSMLDMILDPHPDNWLTLRLAAGPTLNAIALLNRLADHIGVPPTGTDDQTAIVAAIRDKLATLDHAAKIVVLAIDDAEKLPSDTHRALTDLAHTAQAWGELKIVMAADAGDSPLLQNLDRNEPDRTLVHMVQLPDLNEAQTRALIEHRMRRSGLTAEVPFSDAVIGRITEDSGGVPGRIVILARQALLMKKDTLKRSSLLKGLRRRAVYAAAAIGLIVVSVAGWQILSPEPQTSTPVELELPGPAGRPATVTIAEVAKAHENRVARIPESLSRADDRTDTVTEAPNERPAQLIELSPPRTNTSPDAGSPTPPEDSAVPHDAAQDAPPVIGANTPSPETDPGSNRQALSTEPALEPVQARPIAENPPEKASIVDNDKKQVLTDIKPPYSVAWLRAQAQTAYVLQLFGVHDAAAAQRFIKQHDLQNKTAIYESVFDGKPWYVVLFGYYRDTGAAQAAVAELPPELRKLKPWARPLHSISPTSPGRR